MVFVELTPFVRFREEHWTDDELRALQRFLLETPGAGDVIRGTGGLRKLRWYASGRGKRGGVEFFGEDGTFVLYNPTLDYMRGFELYHAKRPATALARIPVDDPVDAQYPDGRIAPFSRLAKVFFDAIEKGTPAAPGFAEGYRAQMLIDAARRSHEQGTWIDVPPGIDA